MTSVDVELIYFQGCPSVDAARDAIGAALVAEGLNGGWREWDRDSPETPKPLRRYGSPTVLVSGEDVAPSDLEGSCCRVYAGKAGLQKVPTVESIRAALRKASDAK